VSGSIDKFLKAMRWAADSDQVGYSQSDRTSVWGNFFGSGRYNADCSSLVIGALKYAGFDTGDATYTGNMSSELTARGWKRVKADGNPQAGDILLNDRDHTAVYLGNGLLAQASQDECGGYSGGARGDQTGCEVNIRGYYSYPWDCYLRWTGAGASSSGSSTPKAKVPPSPQYRVFARGKWGAWKKDGACAGTSGTAIYDFEAKGLGPHGWFQLTLEGGTVLPRNAKNTKHAKRVIGITVYYDTDRSKYGAWYEAVYRVQTASGAWLKWEHDDNDGGAGDDRNAICRVRLKLAQC